MMVVVVFSLDSLGMTVVAKLLLKARIGAK